MSGGFLRTAVFCLCSGAALGCLLLLFRLLRALLRAGRLLTSVLDVLYGLLCGAAAFLCALAVDSGRFRLFQAVLQLLGGWAAAAALGPLIDGLAAALEKIFCKVSGVLRRAGAFFGAHFRRRRPSSRKKQGKTGKKPKKAQKRT